MTEIEETIHFVCSIIWNIVFTIMEDGIDFMQEGMPVDAYIPWCRIVGLQACQSFQGWPADVNELAERDFELRARIVCLRWKILCRIL